MNEIEKHARIVFAQIPGYGPGKLKKIIEKYGSVYDFFRSDNQSLFDKKIGALKEQIANKPVTVFGDKFYPELLNSIPDFPIQLFHSGEIHALSNKNLIAVVGTRNNSQESAKVTQYLVTQLVRLGYGIVSGLAAGIDTIAHEVALKENGYTVAVLGTTLDINYPANNYHLRQAIEENGLVLSEEYRLEKVNKYSFAKRNRIIAGMALGVLVVEAPQKSGALITARLAFDYDRLVFAVPGSIQNPKAYGCNKLISEGVAKLVYDIEAITSELRIDYQKQSQNLPTLSSSEKLIFEFIATNSSVSFDRMIEGTNIEGYKLAGLLVHMEMKKIVEKDRAGNYTLVRNL